MKIKEDYNSILKKPLDQDVPFLYYTKLDLVGSNVQSGVIAYTVPVGYLAYLQFLTLLKTEFSPVLNIKIGREGSQKELTSDYFDSSVITQISNSTSDLNTQIRYPSAMILNFAPINQRLLHKETFYIWYRIDGTFREANYEIVVHTMHLKRDGVA